MSRAQFDPLGKLLHCPSFPDALQNWSVGHDAVPQQTPLTQNVETHWPPSVQLAPVGCGVGVGVIVGVSVGVGVRVGVSVGVGRMLQTPSLPGMLQD